MRGYALALRILSPFVRIQIVLFAGVRAGESLTWLGVLLLLARGWPAVGVCVGFLSALSSVARRAGQGRLLRTLRVEITAAMARGALSETGVLVSLAPDEEPLAQFFDGGYFVARALAEGLPDLCADALASVLLAVALVVFEPPRVVLAIAIGAAVSAVFAFAVRRSSAARFDVAHTRLSELTEPLTALARGREEILATGRRDSVLIDVRERARAWAHAIARAERLAAMGTRVPALAIIALIGAGIVAGKGSISAVRLEDLMPLAAYVCVLPPLVGLMRGSFEIARLAPKLEAVAGYLGAAEERREGQAPLPTLLAPLRWRAVSYAYPASNARRGGVVDRFEGEWSTGTVTALCGANGSGKSTLLRLLLGIVTPTSGKIVIGETALSDIDIDAWRRRVAYLPQRPYFPERATVRMAIAFGGLDVPDSEAERRLEELGVLDSIRNAAPSPPLDVRVDSLSGGQRQRVALTRVFRSDVEVIALDEPDANLDAEGVAMLCALLRNVARNRVVVVAAHSADVVGAADLVVTLPGDHSALGSE